MRGPEGSAQQRSLPIWINTNSTPSVLNLCWAVLWCCVLAQPFCFMQGSLLCWSCLAVQHSFVLPDLSYQRLKNFHFCLLLLVPARTVAGRRQWGLLLLLITSFHLKCIFSKKCAIAQSLHWLSYLIHTSLNRKHISTYSGVCVCRPLYVPTLFKYHHFPDKWIGWGRATKISMSPCRFLCHRTFLYMFGNIIKFLILNIEIATASTRMNDFLWFLVNKEVGVFMEWVPCICFLCILL